MGRLGCYSARSPNKETANEDAAAVIPVGETAIVLAVADGLGGSAAGEQASRVCLQSLTAAIQEGHALANSSGVIIVSDPAANGLHPSRDTVRGNASHAWLRTAILDGLELANREILALGSGAATTISVVEITSSDQGETEASPQLTVRPYHVGDSVILLVGGRGTVKVQTIPHSPVGYGLESGLLNDDEAMHHKDRHIVSNVVGCPEMRIEIGPARVLSPRDTLLLTSDGLADNLHIEEIVQRMRKGPLPKAMQALADEATTRMRNPVAGRPSKADDLTFLLFRPPAFSRRKHVKSVPKSESG